MPRTITQIETEINNLDLGDLNDKRELRRLLLELSRPVTMADADAPNNSVYFSTDQSKLVYKDGSSVVHDLY